MNKKCLLILGIIPPLIGCKAIDANAIKYMQNYDYIVDSNSDFGKDISEEELLLKIDNKQTFPLFFYSSTCSHCMVAKATITSYAREHNTFFYMVEYHEDKYGLLNIKLPSVFPEDVYVPRIILFKEGKQSYEVNSNKLTSKVALTKIFDKYLVSSQVYTLSKIDAYNAFISSHKNYLMFCYEEGNEASERLLGEYIMKDGFSSKKDILVLDKDFINIDGLNYNSAYLYQDGNQIKTIDYSLDDGQSFITEFTSYLG